MTTPTTTTKTKARELLAKITQGKWRVIAPSTYDPFWHVSDMDDTMGCHCFGFARAVDEQSKANAAFIAASPELVQELCAEVERLEAHSHRLWCEEANTTLGMCGIKEKLDAAEAVNRQFHETIIRLGDELAEAKIRANQLEREKDALLEVAERFMPCPFVLYPDSDKRLYKADCSKCQPVKDKRRACLSEWAAEQAKEGQSCTKP